MCRTGKGEQRSWRDKVTGFLWLWLISVPYCSSPAAFRSRPYASVP